MLTELSGQIERITYANEENGYTIAKVKVDGKHGLVTVVGNLMAPAPGEILDMQGEWSKHPKYGEQFRVMTYRIRVPATAYGIRKYLGSGLIKGIGPVMAERIVKRFGSDTLEVIEHQINRLSEVQGIGEKRIRMLKQAWDSQKEIRDLMLFLQTHGVGAGYAAKIFKQYGSGSIQIVRKNPYRLATDIFGIGFLTADRIAEKLGFQKDSPMRAEAGILYVLNRLSDDGHVYYPYTSLIKQCEEILQIEKDPIISALATITREKKAVIEDLNASTASFEENNKAVYLPRFHLSESHIAVLLHRVLISPKSVRDIDSHKAIGWVQKRLSITLADNQKKAVRCALENKAMIITGGPGTGKTTIISAILKIFDRIGVKTLLGAPTGRAAKRMSETTGHEAKTIHRLLEFSLQQGGFKRDADHPLECDVLILDEASMMDTIITYHLLKALPSSATIIFVGDVHQLPSVGAGNVLGDLIESKTVPVVMLRDIFRQAMTSQIIINAHKINNGQIPFVPKFPAFDRNNDFYFIPQEDPEKVLEIIIELTKRRIPRRFNMHPIDDIQVLSPMHRGIVGAENLNSALQDALNPGDSGILRGGRHFRIHDKVMQIKNNYEKDVFNGDIGRIVHIDEDDQEMGVSYDGRNVRYDVTELDEMVLAYAVSVHKSQGSEYPAVVIPILTQHYMLLQRNLLYTAVTRGRKLVVMVGSPKALGICVANNRTQSRFTRLKTRLGDLFDTVSSIQPS